jgi:hypothetical protein
MEEALVELLERASNEFPDKELLVLDIGIFPWFNSIEVSFLFSEDTCDRDDIAAWPHYDYSKFNEGGWEMAKPVAAQLAKEWSEDSDTIGILRRESLVVKLPSIQRALTKFKLAKDFTVQVLNSDDSNSPNYCA